MTMDTEYEQTKVLLVDDDLCIHVVVEGWLAPEGFEVICASSGAEGRELAMQCGPSVIIQDLFLPDASGMDMLALYCAELPAVPVVMLTAEDDPAVIAECRELGAWDCLSKGAGLAELLAAVRAATASVERRAAAR